jgi:hypothetical protein
MMKGRCMIMNLFRNRYFFAGFLVCMSIAVYTLHYIIFRNAHDLFFYLVFDIAFVFVQVLMVSLIIERVISLHEKQAMLNKMNMVIGTFFSEVGTGLINMLIGFETPPSSLGTDLLVTTAWDKKDFEACAKKVTGHRPTLDSSRSDRAALKDFLGRRREFLLGLLGNQNLLEHESFTELLWAVFHLAEELAFRNDVSQLSKKDMEHLSTDMNRAYAGLLREWVAYLKHLKAAYPYLFSLAVRTNPFNPGARVEMEG